MRNTQLDVVTGAFGYTGAFIAQRLLTKGRIVRTLTNHPNPTNSALDTIQVAPLNFDDPAALQRSLEGAEALYNTYWIRFPHGNKTFEQAVENSRTLFQPQQIRRNPAHSSHQHRESIRRFASRLLSWKSASGTRPHRFRSLPCHSSSHGFIRHRRHPHQQHRVAPSPLSNFRGSRYRRMQHSTRLC